MKYQTLLINIIFIAWALFLGGCSVTPTMKTANTVYKENGDRLNESVGQFDYKNIYPYAFDDVFDATYKVLFRKGFSIEKEDRKNGIITGHVRKSQMFSGGSLMVSYTVFASVKEVSDKPRTELKLLLDLHYDVFYGSATVRMEDPEQKFGSDIVSDIQKTISSFQ